MVPSFVYAAAGAILELQWDIRTGRRCPAKKHRYWRTANGKSVLVGVLKPKRLGLAVHPFCSPEIKVRAELDKLSWLGEIKCRIKLRAKPKYEIFLFSTNVSVLILNLYQDV